MIKQTMLCTFITSSLLAAVGNGMPTYYYEDATMSERTVREYVMDAVNNCLLPMFTKKEQQDRNEADALKRIIKEEIYRLAPQELGYYYPTDVQRRVVDNIISFVIQKAEKYAWQRTRNSQVVDRVVMQVQEALRTLIDQSPRFDSYMKNHVQRYVGVSLRIKVYELVDNYAAPSAPPADDERSSLYSCGICLEDYSATIPRVILSCGDGLCFTCARETFLKHTNHSSCGHCTRKCPLCRKKISISQLQQALPPAYDSIW